MSARRISITDHERQIILKMIAIVYNSVQNQCYGDFISVSRMITRRQLSVLEGKFMDQKESTK